MGRLQSSTGVRPAKEGTQTVLRAGSWSNFILFVSGALIGIATAIAQVNHVFDGHLWAAWCLYGVAVLLIVAWFVLSRQNSHDAGRETGSLMKDSGNATATATGGSGGNASIGPIVVNMPGAQSGTTAPPPPEAKPEIPDIRPRPSRLAKLSELFPQNGSDDVYLVLPFRNESTVHNKERKFTAHIAYKRADGSEIDEAEIEAGSWFPFGTNPTTTTLPPKAKRELALLQLRDGKLLTAKIRWLYQRVSHLDIWEPESCGNEITEPIHTIEVTLRGWNLPLLLIYVFDFDKDGPSLRWREG